MNENDHNKTYQTIDTHKESSRLVNIPVFRPTLVQKANGIIPSFETCDEVMVFEVDTRLDQFYKITKDHINRGHIFPEITQALNGDQNLICRRYLSYLSFNDEGDTLTIFESVYLPDKDGSEFEFISGRDKTNLVIQFDAYEETEGRIKVKAHIYYRHWLEFFKFLKKMLKFHWPHEHRIISSWDSNPDDPFLFLKQDLLSSGKEYEEESSPGKGNISIERNPPGRPNDDWNPVAYEIMMADGKPEAFKYWCDKKGIIHPTKFDKNAFASAMNRQKKQRMTK